MVDDLPGVRADVDHPWSEDVDAVARQLGTDPRRGISVEEAARRLAIVGPNELEEHRGPSRSRIFARQFASGMILLLLGAAAVTAFIGDPIDSIAIAVVLVLNAVVGFVQEFRAERAMSALRRMSSPTARVVRDGEERVIPATAVVPGDVVVLSVGDVVEADLRLTEAHTLRMDEAVLTGESEPVAKGCEPLSREPEPPIAERRNMAFMGTAVTYGRGVGLATATGMATELGQIAGLLHAHRAPRTPLQRRLARLARAMTIGAVVLCAAVFVIGVASGERIDQMFLTAVSLAVSAIPEGLPIMITVALALGARRMAARRAIVRSLPAVETLGSVGVICSDKTGTLTQNRMLVERVWTPKGSYRVTGDGYAPLGELVSEPTQENPDDDPDLERLVRVAAACSDATLHAPAREGDRWSATGDPTEAALLAFAAKRGVLRDDVVASAPRVAEVAFDEERRRMSTLHATGGGTWVASKGALPAIAPHLERTHLETLQRAEEAAARLAGEGFRVLAVADRFVTLAPEAIGTVETDLHLLGLVGIADPPRPASAGAIAACRAAGIMPVMVTGDDPRTATAVADRLGMLDDDRAILTGLELDAMDDEAFASVVERIGVYARTTPEQKLRIVRAWDAHGAVVAMTGDGVNDAPALRRADIGVAMGVGGTEVSKEAADMVLADDDFATIVHAVEEGRRIYDNIRRFIRYMLSTNSGEIWLWLMAFALGLPIPMLPLQILWVNLVTDGLPAIALGVELAEADVMRRPPRPREEPIWAHGVWQQAVWVGLLTGAVSVGIQVLGRSNAMPWRTMVFCTVAFLQLGNAIAVRSDRESALTMSLRSNPWIYVAVAVAVAIQLAIVYVPALQVLFETKPLTLGQMLLVALASTVTFWAIEASRWIRRRRDDRRAAS